MAERYENTFVREVKEKNITKPEDILNWYRNLYHTEDNHTEHGIMAYAINDYFADVVSKSEVENYKQIAETQQKLSMDRYFEIKELKEDNERLKDDNEYLQDKVFKVRLEVAREIFEEIEKLHLNITNEFDVRRYTEPKKKYTEEKE